MLYAFFSDSAFFFASSAFFLASSAFFASSSAFFFATSFFAASSAFFLAASSTLFTSSSLLISSSVCKASEDNSLFSPTLSVVSSILALSALTLYKLAGGNILRDKQTVIVPTKNNPDIFFITLSYDLQIYFHIFFNSLCTYCKYITELLHKLCP